MTLGCSGRGFSTGNGSDQFLAVLDGLQVLLLALLGLVLLLQVGLDGFVLCIEVTQVLGQENTGSGSGAEENQGISPAGSTLNPTPAAQTLGP